MKTPDHLDVCNVCFRGWYQARRAASPQVRIEPKTDLGARRSFRPEMRKAAVCGERGDNALNREIQTFASSHKVFAHFA